MKTILVTGSQGQLGSEIRDLSASLPAYTFVFTDYEEMSITDPASIRAYFEQHRPAYLINCAAYTAVDKAESEPELANLVNGIAVGYLAQACAEFGCRMIHISTDYVFDGEATAPLKEDHPVSPVNMYGASKLLGEQEALKYLPDVVIIRTSWVYSAYGKNFVKTMMKLMSERDKLSVVSDQVGNPTYAADLAEAILHMIGSGQWHPGIYHYSNEGIISWYEFAVAIANLMQSQCNVAAIPSSEYPTPAKRPSYSAMDKTLITTTWHVNVRPWRDSLERCMMILQAV